MKQSIKLFKKLSLEKKVSVMAFVGIGIYVLILIISGITKRHLLSQYSVYYAAKIYKISSSKNGDHFYIEYKYNGIRYTGSFKPDFEFKPNREGAFIFIKLSPTNPQKHQYLDKGEVSDSLLKKLPKSGWKMLP